VISALLTFAEGWRYSIVKVHTTAKAFVFFSTLVESLFAVCIFYSAVCKWKEGVKRISAKKWNGKTEDLKNTVYLTFLELYNTGIEVGRSTNLEQKALKRWFVLMYFTYLIFILVQVVHNYTAGVGA
jgi:hypothetical protein